MKPTEGAALGVLAILIAVVAIAAPSAIPGGVFVTGAVGGATLALYALGVVLVYRSDGFLNIAAVQIGALSASLFSLLVHGRTLLRWGEAACPPCFESAGAGANAANVFVALAISLAVAAATGVAIHSTVVRRLRGAPPVVPMVATVFVVQVLAGIAGALPRFLLTRDQRDRDLGRGAISIPGDGAWTFAGASFHIADIALVAAAIAATFGLMWFIRSSRVGASLRAASDNPDRAATLAINVDLIGNRVWLLMGFLSGVAGTLTAANLGVGSVATGLSIATLVRILTVGVVARFASLPMAALAALVIGVLDATVAFGYSTSLPVDGGLVVIVSVLLLVSRAGGDRSTRADAEGASRWKAAVESRPTPAAARALPSVRTTRRFVVGGICVVALGVPWALSASQTAIVTLAAAYAVVGLSVLVLTGWAGTVSLGQFAFAAVGAWTASTLRLPFLIALPVGAAAGAATAVVVGMPALRMRGLQVAVSTLAFSLAVSAVLLNPRYLGSWLPARADRPRALGLDVDDSRVAWYVGLLLLAAAIAVVAGLRRSRTGRVLIGARDNERLAQSFGVDVIRARLLAFAIAGGISGVAGVWVSALTSGVTADTYAPERSVTLFVFSVIGGLGSIAGPILGFAAFALLGLWSSDPTVVALSGGIGGLALILGLPGGLGAAIAGLRDGIVRRAEHRARLAGIGLAAASEPVPIAPNPRPAAIAAGRYALDGQWGVPGGA